MGNKNACVRRDGHEGAKGGGAREGQRTENSLALNMNAKTNIGNRRPFTARNNSGAKIGQHSFIRESNTGPQVLQSCALPTKLSKHT
jgi:hypothetical protein